MFPLLELLRISPFPALNIFSYTIKIWYILGMFRTDVSGQSTENITDSQLELPPDCRVILFNDDFTTKAFVIAVLVSVFSKSELEAEALTEETHQKGKAVIGIYTYDIAVTRTNIATARARKQGFPLRIEAERI